MAKIGELEVSDLHVAPGTITAFFAPSGASVSVTNDSLGNPTWIWVARSTSGAITLTRDRDGRVIYSGDGYTRDLAVDPDPGESETYTINSGSSIVGAMVRRR